MNSFSRTLTRGLTLLMACAALSTLPLRAQDTPPPPPPDAQQQGPPPSGPGGPGGRGMNPERRLNMMKERLQLTDDQTGKIKAIMDDSRAKLEAVRADSSLATEDRRSKNQTIMAEENTHIRAVLTSDQQPKYDEMMQHMRGGHRGQPPSGADGQPPQPPPPPPGTPQQ